jgi:hypothetical protein
LLSGGDRTAGVCQFAESNISKQYQVVLALIDYPEDLRLPMSV